MAFAHQGDEITPFPKRLLHNLKIDSMARPCSTTPPPRKVFSAQTAPPAVVVEGDGSDSEPKKKSVSVEELGALASPLGTFPEVVLGLAEVLPSGSGASPIGAVVVGEGEADPKKKSGELSRRPLAWPPSILTLSS